MRRATPGSALHRFAVISLALVPVFSFAQGAGDFAARTYSTANGGSLPYRIFLPAKATGSPLPAIIYLHGSGGAGADNFKQISGGNTLGTHLWTRADIQAWQQTVVIAPQIAVGAEWAAVDAGLAPATELLLQLVASLAQEKLIDPNRVYLVGQSLGGFGVWELISKRPEIFAAAVALCGGGDAGRVASASEVPMWAFHGAKDRTVPPHRSREMVAALKKAGGTVRYTEYPEAGHDVWTLAFSEPELPKWLLAQARN